MEIEYRAQYMASDFVRAEDKEEAFKAILERIDNIKYEDGSSLDNETKFYILELISEFLSGKRVWKYKYGGLVVRPTRGDNEKFLELVAHLINNLKT